MTLFIENNFVLTLEALYWLDDLKTAKVSDLTPTSYQQIEPKYPKIGLKSFFGRKTKKKTSYF